MTKDWDGIVIVDTRLPGPADSFASAADHQRPYLPKGASFMVIGTWSQHVYMPRSTNPVTPIRHLTGEHRKAVASASPDRVRNGAGGKRAGP